jgi:alkylation response protein AidB-like acyl-CoA dehydrogenase
MADDEGLQQEVDAWLQRNWDPDLTVREWWDRVGDAGWTAPHFTLEWGGRGYSRRSLGTVATRAARSARCTRRSGPRVRSRRRAGSA